MRGTTQKQLTDTERASFQGSLDSSIYHLLEANAARAPDAMAITAPGRRPLSYGRLLTQVDSVIQHLHAMGLGRNDPIAVVLPNGPEIAVSFLAVASACAFAPLNPAYRFNEFDFYFSDLEAKALIVQSGTSDAAIGAARKHLVPIIELTPLLDGCAGEFSLGSEEKSSPYEGGVAERNDTALILHTSGTTSRPKMVSLTHANLLASAGNIAATLQLTEQDRCLNVMPLFHIHGLVGALLSSVSARSNVVCTSGFDANAFFSWLETERPTWYSAVPTMHQAVLSCVPADRAMLRQVPLRFVRSASAPLPVRVMQKLEEVFQVPAIEAYGMTEASHQIASNPLPPGARKPRSVGLRTGTEIAVITADGGPVPCGEVGEVAIRGINVISGYTKRPDTNSESFADGWLRTGDQGYLDADGYLFLTGRLRETINRGGEKISPLEVDEVLKEHPAVLEAVTFAVPHATLGQDVAAAIVLREDHSATAADIQRFAATRLIEFKVPRQVLIVPSIPKTATGKIQRVGLDQRLGLTPSSENGGVARKPTRAPQTAVELSLAGIWSQVLGVEAGIHDTLALQTIGVESNFFDLGGSSLSALYLLGVILKTFGRKLPLSALYEEPTLGGLAALLDDDRRARSWSSMVALQTSGSKPPFFWIHGELSNAFLPRYLGPDQPVYGFAHQSRDGEAAQYTTVEEIASHYLSEMRTIQQEGPYFLGGYCFGGLVAVEMARQLESRNHKVGLLIVLEPDPLRNCGLSPLTKPVGRMNPDESSGIRSSVFRHTRNLGKLGVREKLSYLGIRVQAKIGERIGIVTNFVTRTAKKVVCGFCIRFGYTLPIAVRSFYLLRLYRRATANYALQPFPGSLHLIVQESKGNSSQNWDGVATEGAVVHVVPSAGHTDILKQAHFEGWAAQLKMTLEEAQRRTGFTSKS